YQEGKEPLTSDENFFLQLLKSYFPEGVKIEDIKGLVRKTFQPIIEYVNTWIKNKFEKDYIDFTGWKLFMIFVGLLMLGMFAQPFLLIGGALLAMVSPLLAAITVLVVMYLPYAAILGVIVLMLLIWKDGARILGRWSKEGRLLQLRWQAFERYLKEQTLTPDKKIDDVILWDKLLVYGTALGVADKIIKQTWDSHLPQVAEEVVK
ncbi:MAG: DUF2207 domain-containing protein, partial [Candidatus Micrarchaeota archaeon]|nr:DUF2207 domain-containing protein [Candidatus Micrarchaeota archaeon]